MFNSTALKIFWAAHAVLLVAALACLAGGV